MKGLRWFVYAFALALTAASHQGSLVQQAPAHAMRRTNPFRDDPAALAAGRKLFTRECASCHGETGRGGHKAPPLTAPYISQAPAGALFWVLRNGSLGRGMPSFAHLPEPMRWQIVTYVRSLGAATPNGNPKPAK